MAKFAFKTYLETCLTGKFRSFFQQFAPHIELWTVRSDKTWISGVGLEQAVQIAAFFEETHENPPQIFVKTGGFTPVPTSLGSFDWGQGNAAGEQTVGFLSESKVSMELACAALDEGQANLLAHFLELAIGPHSRFLTNHQLFSGDRSRRNWCVDFPPTWSKSGNADAPLGEDRKRRLWTNSFSFESRVEVGTWTRYDLPINVAQRWSMEPFTLVFPSTVEVGSSTLLTSTGMWPGGYWSVSDAKLASIRDDKWLYAKKAGSLTLRFFTERDSLVAETPVTIVP